MLAEIEQGVRRSAQTRQISPTFVQNLVLVLDPAIVTFVGLICYAIYFAAREPNFGTQFIIATHSPILMSFPNARILRIGEDGIREVRYEDTEQFRLTRDFLNDHSNYLHRLLNERD